MKNRKLLVLLVIVLLVTVAARPMQEQSPQDWLNALVAYFASLAGFAAFVTFAVNIGKALGWVGDNMAPKVVQWFNLAGLVIVGILQAVSPGTIPVVDQILGLLAQLGGVLFPIIALALGWPLANKISGAVHNNVRGFPLLGKSHTPQ